MERFDICENREGTAEQRLGGREADFNDDLLLRKLKKEGLQQRILRRAFFFELSDNAG